MNLANFEQECMDLNAPSYKGCKNLLVGLYVDLYVEEIKKAVN